LNKCAIQLLNIGKFASTVKISITCDATSKNCFFLENSVIELLEAESKHVHIIALPSQVKTYTAQLQIDVLGNGNNINVNLVCNGSQPSINCIGPWTKAVEALQSQLQNEAVAADPKIKLELESQISILKSKLILNFDKILIGKADERQIQIQSTSALPFQWNIILDEIENPAAIKFSQLSGILKPFTTDSITVSVLSSDPQLLSGRFSIQYFDLEPNGNEERTFVEHVSIAGEIYKIQAVAFVGKESSRPDLDFGVLRIGDVAVQALKMGNLGKYPLAFKIEINSELRKSFKCEPMEGIIQAGPTNFEIAATFCSTHEEQTLKVKHSFCNKQFHL
jgi:hypothetical protein